MRPASTIIQWLLVALWAGSVRADCYAHDGVLAKNSKYYNEKFEMVSCGNGTNNCCFQGDKCGSNLLCSNKDGTPTRQYCAASNWDGCSTLCADFATHGGTLLRDCGKNMYCCGAAEKECCDDDSQHFFVDPANGEVKHPSKATGASATASPTWWTVDSKALLAATSTSSASSATSASATNTEFSSSSTSTSPTSTPPGSDTPQDKGSSGISAGAGAGIGIGAAAGVALIVGLGWWLMKRRKQGNPYEAPAEQQQANGSYATGGYATDPKHNDYFAHSGPQPAQSPNELPPQELDGTAQRVEMHGDSSRV